MWQQPLGTVLGFQLGANAWLRFQFSFLLNARLGAADGDESSRWDPTPAWTELWAAAFGQAQLDRCRHEGSEPASGSTLCVPQIKFKISVKKLRYI